MKSILVPNYNDQLNNHFPRIIIVLKGVCVCVSHSVMYNFVTGSSVHGILQARILD